MTDKSNWPKHPPPTQVWFHYHPQPGTYTKGPSDCYTVGCVGCDACIIPAPEGDFWPEPYFSKEDAERALEEQSTYKEADDETIALSDDGWIVIGPYILETKRCPARGGDGVNGAQCDHYEGHLGNHSIKLRCKGCSGTGAVEANKGREEKFAICTACNGEGIQNENL